MKYSRYVFYSVFLLLILLTACGPSTATPTPMGDIPKLPGPNQVQVNQNNPIVSTACDPGTPSIVSSVNFCANTDLKLGGATIVMDASEVTTQNATCTLGTSSNDFKFTCYGPQTENVTIEACNSCGPAGKSGSQVDWGQYPCSKGYVKMPDGISCLPDQSSNGQGYESCPAGSHYDNAQQWCVDDVTQQKLTDLCPNGTKTYLPSNHHCLPINYPEVYNCQTFTVPLGACLTKIKSSESGGSNSCEPPPSGCPIGEIWKAAKCSCDAPR